MTDYFSDGSKLFYTTLGKGPSVVLLHPTPLDHRFWVPVAHHLAAKYRLIIPDLRGHGRSELGSALPTGGFARVPGAPVPGLTGSLAIQVNSGAPLSGPPDAIGSSRYYPDLPKQHCPLTEDP